VNKAYGSNSLRKLLRENGIKPVIPGRPNRKKCIRYDKEAYRGRNKDFRRVATRYASSPETSFHRVSRCCPGLLDVAE
jgi:hypothetical protein